jgi:hypothetical protein
MPSAAGGITTESRQAGIPCATPGSVTGSTLGLARGSGSAIYAGRARRHAVRTVNREGSIVAREGELEGREFRRSRVTWLLVVLDGVSFQPAARHAARSAAAVRDCRAGGADDR